MRKNNAESVYSYLTSSKPTLHRIALLTGVNRSGTTIIGNIAGSLRNVEYAFEPWIFHSLPMLVASGQVSFSAAEQLISTYCGEYFLEALLGRNVNIRPSDDTCVWKRKSEDEIQWRFAHLKNRWDAKKVSHEQDYLFAIKTINYGPFLNQFLRAFPQAKIINIVRHPFNVSASIVEKGWVNLDHLQTLEELPIKKKMKTSRGELFLPWWLREEDAEAFLLWSEPTRALYSWCYMVAETDRQLESLGWGKGHPQYLEIRFEDFLRDPKRWVEDVSRFLNADATDRTGELIRSLKTEKAQKIHPLSLEGMREKDRDELLTLMERYGYSRETIRV